MAEITFVIPARNLDTLHRTLSMLAFQKDAGLRAVIVDLVGSEAVRSIVPDFEHSLPVSVVTVDLAGQPHGNAAWTPLPRRNGYASSRRAWTSTR